MKFLKMLVLGAVLAISACSTMPYDPDAELDTMNKKLLVVGQEVKAVVKSANELYMAGLLPIGSKEYKVVDSFIAKLNSAYDDLRVARDLAEFNLKEANLRKTLLDLRNFLLTVQQRSEYDGGERNQVVGYGYSWSYN